mgnify:CR=1 FL=1
MPKFEWDLALDELETAISGTGDNILHTTQYFVESCAAYLKQRYESGDRSQELYDLMRGEYNERTEND